MLILLRQFLRLYVYTVMANTLTPLPSNIVAVMLGYASNIYGTPLLLAIFACVTALLTIDLAFYSFFRFFGGRLGLIEKIIKKETVETYRRKMSHHAGKTVLFLRFYPGPGILSPILAGALKVPLARYLPYDLLGIGIASVVYVTAGDLFHLSIDKYITEIGYEKDFASIALIVVAGLALSWHIYYKYIGKMTVQRLKRFMLSLRRTHAGTPK